MPERSTVASPVLHDLRALLARLRAEGELVEIDASVDPHLEAAEIHRRVIAGGGPALLFRRPAPDPALRALTSGERLALVSGGEAVTGAPPPRAEQYDARLVTNLFGTARRVELAFGR